MSDFKIGDDVMTEDGEKGTVFGKNINGKDQTVQSYLVKVNNQIKEFLPEGLEHLPEKNKHER